MDESKVSRARSHSYTGAVVEHRRLDGARLSRIMHPPGQRIDAHSHDWPVLTLYRLGGYRERGEEGVAAFDGPSAVFQPCGAAHADEIGAHGLETLALTFDPAWLSRDARAALPEKTCWRHGGQVALDARALAALWVSLDPDARALRAATSRFLLGMFSGESAPTPAWARVVHDAIEAEQADTGALARRLSRHPAWLARAYRAWRGEGIAEGVRRRRVERATVQLRAGALDLADIAAACGFCDQSHMNRAFRTVLGRTPLAVRREAALLAPLHAHAGSGV